MVKSFKEYEDIVLPLARYPNIGENITYPALGLCGEAGEFADKVKKLYRDSGGDLYALSREQIEGFVKELGDVLWYIAAAAFELGYTLEEVANMNIEKLLDRHKRGALHGSGDDR